MPAAVRVSRLPLATLSDRQAGDLRRDRARGACSRVRAISASATTDLASGAGHDAGFMSRICKSAMVFVPCKGGKSHVPEEWSDREQIAAGAAVILQAVKALDKTLR